MFSTVFQAYVNRFTRLLHSSLFFIFTQHSDYSKSRLQLESHKSVHTLCIFGKYTPRLLKIEDMTSLSLMLVTVCLSIFSDSSTMSSTQPKGTWFILKM